MLTCTLHTVTGARSLRQAQGSLSRGTCGAACLLASGVLCTTGAGCFTAPPGTPFLIDIALRQRIPRDGLRIVRASIDGREINEQVVLRSGSGTARFCGWLEDASGDGRYSVQPWP